MMDKSRLETAGTDYTLQTSLIGLGGILSAALSGVLAEAIGYRGVFTVSVFLLLSCMMLIHKKFIPTVNQPSRTVSGASLRDSS